VGLDDDDPGVFQRIMISVWIRNSTGPSPLLWRLILDPIHFPVGKRRKDFCRDWEKYDSLNVVLPALKDVLSKN